MKIKKELLHCYIVTLLILFVGLSSYFFIKHYLNPKINQPQADLNKQVLGISQVTVENVEFDVELAQTPAEREKGLSNRAELCDQCGMLFIFENNNYHSFWMKDTLVPLDIIWIDEIQSDLFKFAGSDDFLLSLKNLHNYLLNRFIQLAHKIYGSSKIMMPTVDIKREEYDTDSPMSIYKEQKVSELVERQLETLTLIEAMNIAGNFFSDLLDSMDDEEIDEMYTDMGAGRNGIH